MSETGAEPLRAAPLFASLDAAQMARVKRHARVIALDDGQWLFRQGDQAARFYFLQQGQLRLFRLAADGGEKTIEIVSPGQTFAEALMFLQMPRYPVCASALAPSRVIALDAGDFAAMLHGSVATCFALLGGLSQRLRGLIAEIDDLTLRNATARVARYLATRAPRHDPVVRLEARKAVLASRLSVQPETFSRALRALADAGIITIDGAEVTITDLPALREAGELDDLA